MLMCEETVTLIRCDGTNFTKEIIEGCSWFEKTTSSMGDKSQIPGREIKVRIPAKNAPTMFPKAGDYIVRGALTSAVTSTANLKGKDYARIMVVADNRRGGLPHIGVTGQ